MVFTYRRGVFALIVLFATASLVVPGDARLLLEGDETLGRAEFVSCPA